LIGLSTVRGSFTEQIIREMARKTERPIVLPLSNPTEKSEAKPEDLIRWTDGRAIVATGSPFPPVSYENRKITVAQCNNVYIFPSVGLGAIAARASRITDSMLQAAAHALVKYSPALADPNASLLPPLTDARRLSRTIAIAVGGEAQRGGVAPITSEEELVRRVNETQWTPEYAF
jgi:malate dehydrogenase (oxaloacetate-decarboxylating)